jgi:dipeptidyl aminopeptidase/acylaminoacyl peptidase
MTILRHAAIAATLLFASAAGAQAPTAEDFAKHSEISEAVISPTGKYVALAVPTPDGRETQLHIVRTDGGKPSAHRFGKNEHIIDIVWTTDERVVVSRARKEFGEERPFSTGQLFTVTADGKDQEMLFGYVPDVNGTRGRRKDNGFASVARVLKDEPGYILVHYYSYEQGSEPDSVVFKVNTETGDRKEIERVKRAVDMNFDQSGKLRVLVTLDEKDLPQVFYRPTPSSEMQPMPKALAGYRTYGAWFEKDPQVGYVYISDDGEPAQLFRVDFSKGTREKVAGKPDQAVSYTQISGNNGTPFAVVYDAGRPSVEYVAPNSEWAKLHAALLQRFPGQLLLFSGFTRDEQTVLFHVFSDRNPGAYYQYSLRDKTISLVVEFKPWIKPEQLAPMQPVEFTAKDGTKLFGFLTSRGTGPMPLVVIPHGGPIGPYDSWGYDADAQFLASRGYAVLQVNFRGSGGRGFNFQQAGWTQWGDLIQDDIADGVRWAIAQGKADPGRVCIYGASFGGYSALMNPVRNPGMYKCAVGYAGVYDLNLLSKTDWSVTSKAGRREFDREVGADPARRGAQSPTTHAAKIDIPVFLVHGEEDQTAKMDQYKAMESALAAAGRKPQSMVVEDEGHGFYNPKNVADLYNRMEAFFNANIGTGAASGGASR